MGKKLTNANGEMKINVSFKKKEQELYDFIKGKRSPSNYIKDAVEFYRKHQDEVKIETKEKAPQVSEETIEDENMAQNNAKELLNF